MKNVKKTLLLSVCALILVAATVMGTMAYLTAEDSVTNTFAATTLITDEDDFVLKEHKLITTEDKKLALDEQTEVQENNYPVLPGVNLPKDPFVRVTVQSDAYLFLEVENNLPAGMTFTVDTTKWDPLMGEDGSQVKRGSNLIYVRKAGIITPAEDPEILNILTNKTVEVANDFDPSTLTGAEAESKTLSFYGYLVQATADDYNTALGAWNAFIDSQTP